MIKYHSKQRQNTAGNDSQPTELSRRNVLGSIGLLAGLPRSSTDNSQYVAQAQTETTESWSEFGHSVKNKSYAPENTGPKKNVGSQWQFTIGDVMRSSPAVVDGTVYVGSKDGNVYAIDANNETEEWRFDTGGEVQSSPTIDDNTVYIGNDQGNLYALSTEDGTQRWMHETNADVNSAPKIADGRIFIGLNDVKDTSLIAVSADSGQRLWDVEFGTATTVAINNETIFVGTGMRDLRAYDAATGEEQWLFSTDGFVFSSPAVSDGRVYFGSNDNTVYSLDAASGTDIWQYNTQTRSYHSPAVANGTVYGTSFAPEKSGRIFALDAEDGTEQWNVDGIYGYPTVVDETIYIGDEQSNLYALSADNGSQRWVFQTNSPILSSAAIANGTVYIATNSGTVYALAEGYGQSSSSDDGSGGQSSSSDDGSGGIATFFSSSSKGVNGAGLLAGIGSLGVGYLLYKRRRSDEESKSMTTNSRANSRGSERDGSTSDDGIPTDLTYADIDTDQRVSQGAAYTIKAGEIPSHDLLTWVITPVGSAGDTIATATTEDFLNTVEQWANVDFHEYLTTVYGHGTDPLPWIATEPADGKELGDEFSIADRIDYLTHVCEAVHHVSRYGVVYDTLTPESILVNGEGDLQLRGVIDEFDGSEASAYQSPEDTVDSTHDAADVYRVGAVAYEILTGEQPTTNGELSPPSTVNPDLPAEIDSIIMKAIAETPEERYETVLHLRDALSEV